MQIQNEDVPIHLEALNTRDEPIASIPARLRHLSGQSAVIIFDRRGRIPGLHWGSRTRFHLEQGAQRYEVIGMVVGSNLRETEALEDTETRREILLRVWECLPSSQRREGPRTRVGFAVMYQVPDSSETDMSAEAWKTAQCVDISAGGIRLRLDCPEVVPERIRVALTPPDLEAETPPVMHLAGRVLRLEPVRTAQNVVQIAVKFENLSVEEGLMLARFIHLTGA